MRHRLGLSFSFGLITDFPQNREIIGRVWQKFDEENRLASVDHPNDLLPSIVNIDGARYWTANDRITRHLGTGR